MHPQAIEFLWPNLRENWSCLNLQRSAEHFVHQIKSLLDYQAKLQFFALYQSQKITKSFVEGFKSYFFCYVVFSKHCFSEQSTLLPEHVSIFSFSGHIH